MNRLLIVGVLLLLTVPLYAEAQQPNTAKLKADAQKVVSDIRGDKAKTQAYCQINNLGGQMVEAAQEKDGKKAEALFQRVDDLEKQLGPQYHALFDALANKIARMAWALMVRGERFTEAKLLPAT